MADKDERSGLFDDDPFDGAVVPKRKRARAQSEIAPSGVPELLRGRAPEGQLPTEPILPAFAEASAPEMSPESDVTPAEHERAHAPLQAHVPVDADPGSVPVVVDPAREGIRVVDPTPLVGESGDPADDVPTRRYRVLEDTKLGYGLLRKGKVVDERTHDVDYFLRVGVKMEPVE